MPTNDFKPFATAGGANVDTQAEYLARAERTAGMHIGIAESKLFNKVWRQGGFMAAVLGEYILAELGVDVLDDGDLVDKRNLLIAAIASQVTAASILTAAFEGAEIAIVNSTDVAQAHGLGARPKLTQAFLRCKTAEFGYAINDEVPLPDIAVDVDNSGTVVYRRGGGPYANAANVGVVVGGNGINILRRDAPVGNEAVINYANWRIVLRAWR